MVKNLLLLFFSLVYCTVTGYAQNSISGVILPVTLVKSRIDLLKEGDLSIYATVTPNSNGLYQITNMPNGRYFIRFSATGYHEFIKKDIVLNNSANVLIDPVTLTKLEINLKEVVITNNTSVLERKNNIINLNVAKSSFAASLNGMELLQLLPGVNIGNNGTFTIAGNSNVAVYINDKPSNIKGANLLDYLKNIQSANIDKIELTNGANAQADANSNGGIINIKFKKSSALGYNTTLTAGASLGCNYSYLGGFSISNKSLKNSWFINFDYQKKKTIDESFIKRTIPTGSLFDIGNGDTKTRNNYNLFFGNDYTIDKKNSIGFSVNMYRNNMVSHGLNLTEISNSGIIDSTVTTSSLENREINNLSGNLNYSLLINKKGAKLSTDFDYLNYERASTEDLTSFFYTKSQTKSRKSAESLNLENHTPSSVHTYSTKADISFPLKENETLSLGTKAIWVATKSNRVINVKSNYSYLQNPNTLFNYQENTFAGYVNYKNATAKNKFEIGFRLEKTISTGDTSATQQLIRKNFLNFFPNISYTQILNTKNSLTLSYRKGITRPKYEELNPFLYFLDQFTYSQGNPQLAPIYNHSLKLDCTIMSNYNVAFNYNYIEGFAYALYQQNLSTNITIASLQNYNYRQSLGIEINVPVKIRNTYTLNIYGEASHDFFKYTNNAKQVDYNESTSFSFNLNHTIKFPHKFTSTINMVYESATAYGIYAFKPLYYGNIGISKSILAGKGNIRLVATDLFDSRSNRYSTQAFDLNIVAKEKAETRSFRIAFNYKIGENRATKKAVKTEEQERVVGK